MKSGGKVKGKIKSCRSTVSCRTYPSFLRKVNCVGRVGTGAHLNFATLIAYLAADVFEFAENPARDNKKLVLFLDICKSPLGTTKS